MHKIWSLVIFFILLCACASAQVPTKGNVFFGYSYDHTALSRGDGGSLNGWNGSLEGNFLPWIGLVVDVDGHYGSRNYETPCGVPPCGLVSADVAAHNVLFGPRVSVTVSRYRPFAELLFGAAHVSRSHGISDSNTSFASAVGGGLDYKLFGPVWARGQLDWIQTRFYGATQNGTRLSTGISVRF